MSLDRLVRQTWAVPGLVALVVCLLGITRTSLWQDELATMSAASRSLPDLVRLGTHVDGVLLPYYALMHVWTALVGISPLALRLPSAIAMALAVAIVARLGGRLFSPAAGVWAGLVLAVSPSVSLYGTEARPYALTFLAVAVATSLLVSAVERPTRARWLVYGAALVAVGVLQLTAVLVAPAHLLYVAAVWRGTRERRLLGAPSAVAGASVALLPVIAVGHRQQNQIDWIDPPTWSGVLHLPLALFVDSRVAVAVIAAALLGAAGVALRERHARLGTQTSDARASGGRRSTDRMPAVLLALGLAVVPLLALPLISLVVPLARFRYLLYSQAGWALLAGVLLAGLGWRPAAAAVALLVALAVPTHLDLRGDTRVGQPDYRAMAAVISAAERPGDAMVVPTDGGVRFRVGLSAYLRPEQMPDDVLRVRSAASAAALDAKECRPATCFGDPSRIWVGCRRTCTDPLAALRPETRRALTRDRYAVAEIYRVSGGAIALMTRAATPPPR